MAIRVPPVLSAITYRAYREPLGHQSVLAWAVNAFRRAVPVSTRIVCVCESDRERRCIETTEPCTEVDVVSSTAPSEEQLCRHLVEQYDVSTLMMVGLGHAVAADTLIQKLFDLHRSLKAELTALTDATFLDSMFVLESSLLGLLLVDVRPDMPHGVLQRAAVLQAARRAEPATAREFVWLRISASAQCGIEVNEWPERIAIQTARDVEILRQAVSTEMEGERKVGLIRAWKQAAIATKEQRLTTSMRSQRQRKKTTRPARVLYASSSAGFTGAQQSLCHLIGALDRTRYEPLAIVSYSGTFCDELRARGVKVICPEESIGQGDTENVALAQHLVAMQEPDLIHANHTIGMPLTAAVLIAGVPLVQHVRVPTPTDLRPQIHAAEAVIAVSHFVRDRITQLDVDPSRIEVVWNGVDVESFTPPDVSERTCARRSLGVDPTEFVVTMIARMAPSKRHDTIIDAFDRLRRDTGRGLLLLIGDLDGPRAYYHDILTRIRERGLSGHVTLIDFVADVRVVLHASDVLALLSEDEPLSRAVIEAMALGLSVVSGDSGGTQEVISHGHTGYIVPCGNVDRLASTLRGLLERPEEGAAVGRKAASWVRAYLTAEHCARKTMEIYDRVLNGHYGDASVARYGTLSRLPWQPVLSR